MPPCCSRFFHAGAYAWQVAGSEGSQSVMENVRGKGYEAVWFFHVRGDFG